MPMRMEEKVGGGRQGNRLPLSQFSGALLLSPVAGIFLAMALSAFIPMSRENQIFFGGLLVPFAWVGLMIWGFLARSSRRCWAGLLLVFLASFGIVVIDGLLG